MNLYSNNAETAVLGACIVDNSSIDQAKRLTADDFYIQKHKEIFSAICNLYDNGIEVTPITLDEHLGSESGLYSLLIELGMSKVRGLVSQIDIVLDYSLRRGLQQNLSEISHELSSRKAIDVVNELQDKINRVAEKTSVGDVLSINDLIHISADKMEASQENVRVGVSSGYDCIDERLGYKNIAFGEVTAVGALSKNGKTLFMNSIAANCDLQADEIGHVFSIEMPVDAMFNSVISAMTGVPADFYCRQNFYATHYGNSYDEMFAKWSGAAQALNQDDRLTFDGKKDVDADYLCAEMKKTAGMARAKGKKLKLVFVDHFHRMNFHTDGGSMTYAMRDSIRKIKNTAADLGLAVVLLVQLNNRAENDNPTSFHILDSSSVRHEMQCFIGTRLYRQDGRTVFGVYFDSQRFASFETKFDPVYMELRGGRLQQVTDFIPRRSEQA